MFPNVGGRDRRPEGSLAMLASNERESLSGRSQSGGLSLLGKKGIGVRLGSAIGSVKKGVSLYGSECRRGRPTKSESGRKRAWQGVILGRRDNRV